MQEDHVQSDHVGLLLDLFSDPSYKPMKFKELCILLNVPKEERSDFKMLLDEMISSGKIRISSDNRYMLPNGDEYTGIFSGTARGFGFVKIAALDEEIFIPEENTMEAMQGDTVAVRILKRNTDGRRSEGKVERILTHAHTTLVGTYQKEKNYGFVTPNETKIRQDIFVHQKHSLHAKTGDQVVVRIDTYGSKGRNPEGRIIEILGKADDPRTDLPVVMKTYHLPEKFPDDVQQQLQNIPWVVTEEDLEGRADFRDMPIVTIDGEDAKDFDDAVSISKENGIYHLGVHIADVTHYVTEGSPLDQEALKRGTSVYLIDHVVPMLPKQLSNGICSLNEGCDRLTLSCLMDIDESGEILNHEIVESVICSSHRMTYTAVNEILTDPNSPTADAYRDFVPTFQLMKEAADALRGKRKQRGGIDFDFPESKIILNQEAFPIDIRPYERNAATDLIEDFMLAANETIAEDYYWQDLPFLYRIHEKPDMEKINRLTQMISSFGYTLKKSGGEVYPKEFQKLLGKIHGKPEESLISRLVLRSLKRARYSPKNAGHFGLAANYYCHFTSPIRRYPDLQIHRIIKENLHGHLDESRQAHYQSILGSVADTSSRLERRADDAERDLERLKKIEYMSAHIGETYTGIISGVSNWCIYVELENTCEGLIRFQKMEDDIYEYDETTGIVSGTYSGKTYELGQRVEITVESADKAGKTIEFLLVDSIDEGIDEEEKS